MGTSGSSSGSGSNSPLVPSWLGGGDAGPLPGSDGPPDGNADGTGEPGSGAGNQRPPIPPPGSGERFRSARTNFSRFAGSGGSNGRALRRAVRDYARSGVGGSGNAVRRMAPSAAAASKALGVFRMLQRDGAQETLRRLNLESLAGRGVQDILIGLTEVVCRDGGPVDEAIARDAWLETIGDLDKFGIDGFETLSNEQIKELYLSFIAHSIETRLYQEIGVNGFKFADDISDIEGFDEQFRDYIDRAVHDAFSGDLTNLSAMNDDDIRTIVEDTYRETWDLLQTWGDQEE